MDRRPKSRIVCRPRGAVIFAATFSRWPPLCGSSQGDAERGSFGSVGRGAFTGSASSRLSASTAASTPMPRHTGPSTVATARSIP